MREWKKHFGQEGSQDKAGAVRRVARDRMPLWRCRWLRGWSEGRQSNTGTTCCLGRRLPVGERHMVVLVAAWPLLRQTAPSTTGSKDFYGVATHAP